jgi:hypothetical protein
MPHLPSAMPQYPQYFKFGTVILGIICKTTIDPSHYESRATVTRDATIPEPEVGDWSERRAPLKPLTQLRDACFA